jgi:DNA-binding GntR family transcriptional regulator
MLGASSRRRVETESRSGIAYRKIKGRIISLDLPPASVLDESQLAQELEVGLTPVRQALRRLALENLVVILPRRGTIVADLNLSDLQKIFEMRVELESLAAKLAADRATAHEQGEMDRLCLEVEQALADGDNYQLIDLDRRLHSHLATCAHNEFLAETLDWLYGHVLRLWNLSLNQVGGLEEALHEHLAIAEAVKTGEGQKAALIMHTHVDRFQQEITRLLL